MKPRILLSAGANTLANYEAAVRQAGGEPFAAYLPPVDISYDALVLCGGSDVDPALFGQENTASVGIDPARDAVEMELARLYLAAGKPILGICRGHQLLNIVLGGTLIQDIGDPLHLFHTRGSLPEDRIHTVRCAADGFLFPIYGPTLATNSSHHQAVDHLGEGLKAVAWSESGLIEALEHVSLPVRSLQWHPERMTGAHRRPDAADGAPIFEWLIAAAAG